MEYSTKSQYSDINQEKTTQQPLVEGVEAVRQSILNILNTPKGTRFFMPEFGSNLHKILFEPMNQTTELMLMNEIYVALKRWEPRVNLIYNRCKVIADYTSLEYSVTLCFSIKGFGENSIEYLDTKFDARYV